MKKFLHEFWIFGLKQANACLFGGFLIGLIVLTNYWYPFSLPRYDFLFIAAVAFQIFLLVFKFETLQEAKVIFLFHIVATLMEIFKTSDQIGSWRYPEHFYLGFKNYPLFAGFMYSAVGSYIARVWRIFDFQFTHYPLRLVTFGLALAMYLNFFTHHFIFDLRWVLIAAVVFFFGKTQVYFKVQQNHRHMPMVLGFFLVSLFIWFAENIATYSRIWLYPNQMKQWHMVPIDKLSAWFMLMIVSFILVSLVHKPKVWTK